MLTILYGASVLLMILVPVILAAGLRRISSAPWLLFGVGSGTFVLSQVVHLPLNQWLADLGLLPGTVAADVPIVQTALIAGLTAGLCEELARAGGYALLRRLRPAWMRLQDAVMLGLGHGGIESMIFGGVLTAATISSLLPLIGADLSGFGLTPDQLANLEAQLDSLAAHPWNSAFPLLERIVAISAHAVFSLMVWKAFTGAGLRRNWFYIPLAILYHAGVDFAAVYGMPYLKDQTLLFELSFIGMLVPGYVWAAYQIRLAGRTVASAEPVIHAVPQSSIRSELAVYRTAVGKELVQLWRTKRILVTGAVFLVFGMGSPLIAKVIPDIFKSVEGMEPFASLIPEPTAADAMVQYIKNLTQFGFLLAVLLAMGTVAGEKEHGVAPMILSKPMPRWAFIAAKFTAQSVMYLVCFALSGAGAYYYTWILFGPLDPGAFLLVNGLLLVWILTFVALAVLASTLGKTTVSAGGIGFVLAVFFMLAGSIPRYGVLFPQGLLSWADQAAQTAAGKTASSALTSALAGQIYVNGGALASAVVLIVICLILTVGFFEQQEL
ncbi:MAG: YhfC family intramembrane metalloprotease [Anaerolineales bacterium]|nr:YhfC family intramembrane metalloprotease [Anaerolineales bacterium]